MDKARVSVMAIGLAGLLLTSFAATGKTLQSVVRATPEARGNADSCNGRHEPPSHAEGKPNRNPADPQSPRCSGNQGPAEPDPTTTQEDDNMNFKQVMAAAALATVAGGVHAAEIGFLAKDCRTSSGTPDAGTQPYSTPEVPVPEVFCISAGSLGRICNPAPTVPSQEVPGQTVPGVPGGDQYCGVLTFVGTGAMSVLPYGAGCSATQQAITVDRSGDGVWTFSVTKNGKEEFSHSIETASDPSAPSPFPLELCVGQ